MAVDTQPARQNPDRIKSSFEFIAKRSGRTRAMAVRLNLVVAQRRWFKFHALDTASGHTKARHVFHPINPEQVFIPSGCRDPRHDVFYLLARSLVEFETGAPWNWSATIAKQFHATSTWTVLPLILYLHIYMYKFNNLINNSNMYDFLNM